MSIISPMTTQHITQAPVHIGRSQLLSTLHSAVPVVEYPVAHVAARPVPVADSTAEGVVPLAATVAGHGVSVSTRQRWVMLCGTRWRDCHGVMRQMCSDHEADVQ